MKTFLGRVFATFIALILFATLVLGLLLGTEQIPAPVKDKTLLVLDLGVPISDRPPRQKLASMFAGALNGSETERQPLRPLVEGIRKAADDDRIVALYLKNAVARQGYASGWAALRELRAAIDYFRSKGKPVLSWQNELDEATLYVLAGADQLVLNPLGTLEFNGFASEIMFFKQAFERFGVDVQVTRVGKYKSAVEPFLLERMSEPNRQQMQALLDDLFDEVVDTVAEGSGVSRQQLLDLAHGTGFLDAQSAVQAGLVTRAGYLDEVLARLRELTGTEAGEDIENQSGVQDYLASLREDKDDKNKIAVIYAEGDIVDGDDNKKVGGDYLAGLLRKAREDEDIKAVVLRVNSPGGSAAASEVIQRETRLLKKEKPLVVSMGAVAASGGYWISAYADEVIAQPNTITGSIGVFGLFFNVQKLLRELGVNVDVAQTTPSADLFSLYRPKTEAELALIQRHIDFVYDQFLSKVSQGRDLDRAKLEEIAQGRVWSGKRALELGLVNSLGGLSDALAAAARRAELGDEYTVVEYQQEKDLIQALLEEMGLETRAASAPYPVLSELWMQLQTLLQMSDPRGIYARLPYDLMVR